jgi:RNA polymerase sigma factor (sigma-70 family)
MDFSYSQLRTAELAGLIAAAQADAHDDSPVMNEIIRRFDIKAQRIAAAVCACPADRDDAANAARLALVRAVRRHEVNRPGFAAYAVTFMTGAARRESMRLARPPETCLDGTDLTAVIERTPALLRLVADNFPGEQGWSAGPIAKIVTGLPQQQQVLVAERYIQDMDIRSIAQMHGTSESAVSQRLKTVHKHVLARIQPELVPQSAVAA